MTFNYTAIAGWIHDHEDLDDIKDDSEDLEMENDNEPWYDRKIRTSYYPAAGRDRLYLHILANELGISKHINWDYINQSLSIEN